MSGDESATLEAINQNTGIIPRVIDKLFGSLELLSQDYTVRCSFIELYNEELRDLISEDDDRKVRIFEDSSKKGIVIHGLDEVFISDASSGLLTLQQGLRKRQVAATKINDFSSRSHTIFTIVVSFDQSTTSSFDPSSDSGPVKVVKINLVDLAGSENIAKSGAERMRAREAGSINQSLLTLGRVINGLVDKTSHIPYRESKLTRLLQDSLGGHTKTCIIATISPAEMNFEETLSTLEYASRAKNIKNRPQVAAEVSKKVLLRQYASELERTRAELTATRKKNGIYMTELNYNELQRELTSKRQLLDEQQRRLDTLSKQLNQSRDTVVDTKSQLQDIQKKHTITERDLNDTLINLDTTMNQLQTTENDLQNESSLRKAAQENELHLKQISSDLLKSLKQSCKDVSILQSKLESMRALQHQNRSALTVHSTQLDKQVNNMMSVMKSYNTDWTSLSMSMKHDLDDYVSKQNTDLNDIINAISQRLTELNGLTEALNQEQGSSNEELSEKFKHTKDQLDKGLKSGLALLLNSVSSMTARIDQQIAKQQTLVQTNLQGIDELCQQVFQIVEQQNQSHQQEILKLQDQLKVVNSEAKETGLTYKTTMLNMLQKQQTNAANEKQRLLEQIESLIQGYTDVQAQHWSNYLDTTSQDYIESMYSGLYQASQAYETEITKMYGKQQDSMQQMDSKRNLLSKQMEGLVNGFDQTRQDLVSGGKEFESQAKEAISNQLSNHVDNSLASFNEEVTAALNQQYQHHNKLIQEAGNMIEKSAIFSNHLQARSKNVLQSGEDFSKRFSHHLENMQLDKIHQKSIGDLELLRKRALSFEILQDQATGTTPKRQKAKYDPEQVKEAISIGPSPARNPLEEILEVNNFPDPANSNIKAPSRPVSRVTRSQAGNNM